jgi:hypothetical protein
MKSPYCPQVFRVKAKTARLSPWRASRSRRPLGVPARRPFVPGFLSLVFNLYAAFLFLKQSLEALLVKTYDDLAVHVDHRHTHLTGFLYQLVAGSRINRNINLLICNLLAVKELLGELAPRSSRCRIDLHFHRGSPFPSCGR